MYSLPNNSNQLFNFSTGKQQQQQPQHQESIQKNAYSNSNLGGLMSNSQSTKLAHGYPAVTAPNHLKQPAQSLQSDNLKLMHETKPVNKSHQISSLLSAVLAPNAAAAQQKSKHIATTTTTGTVPKPIEQELEKAKPKRGRKTNQSPPIECGSHEAEFQKFNDELTNQTRKSPKNKQANLLTTNGDGSEPPAVKKRATSKNNSSFLNEYFNQHKSTIALANVTPPNEKVYLNPASVSNNSINYNNNNNNNITMNVNLSGENYTTTYNSDEYMSALNLSSQFNAPKGACQKLPVTAETNEDMRPGNVSTLSEQAISTAEQKRRCNIQYGFDRLQTLVPSLKDTKNNKASKATMLKKTSEYIKELQIAREKRLSDLSVYTREIEELSNKITECQIQLPANGVSIVGKLNKTEVFEQKFKAYVKEKTVENWKFYLFSLILRPLFENFVATINTSCKEELERTFCEWQEKFCTLIQLRPSGCFLKRLITNRVFIFS